MAILDTKLVTDAFELNLECGKKPAQAIAEIAQRTGKTPTRIRQIVKAFRKSPDILARARENAGRGEDDLLEIASMPNDVEAIVRNWAKPSVEVGYEGGEFTFKPVPTFKVDLPIESSEDYEIKASEVKKLDDSKGYRYPHSQKKTERWLIIPDLQIPFHDQKSLDVVLSYASEIEWDGCIQLGDFLDWDFISRWTRENARKIEGQRFLQEYIHGNAVLDQIQDAVRNKNKDATIVVIEGNHDWRVENVIDKTPALEGLIEMETNLRFAERDMIFWRYWTHRKPFILGKAWFIHGEYIGANHAKKTADSFHRNTFYGHTHDVMSYTKTTAWGDSIMCGSLGTLSVLDLEYMGHRPSNWQQSFSEFFIQPNGNFNHYITNIIDHSFVAVNGRKYSSL